MMAALRFVRSLFGWGLYLSLGLTLLVIVLAYQARPTYTIDVGGPEDVPYLEGVHANEHNPTDATITYRWTTAEAWIKLPGIGRADYDVELELSGDRPAGFPPPHVVVSIAPQPGQPGKQLAEFDPVARQPYPVTVSRQDVGERGLFLSLRTTDTFQPQGDARELGTLLFNVTVKPGSAAGFVAPPLFDLTNLLAAAALFGVIMALAGWGSRGVALLGGAWALLTGFFLVWNRPWLAVAEPGLLQALVAALILVLLLRLIVPPLYRLGGIDWPASRRTVLLTIFAVAFIFRLAGELHPEIYIVDLVFHSHRFDQVLNGDLLFTIRSAEWNNHETFYLPTAYVFMLPLRWLITDNLLVIRLFSVGLDTLGVFLIYYLGRKAMGSSLAGLFAAALYVTLPMAVLPFSWGITTNVFGQFMALAVVALALGAYPRLNRPPVLLALVLLLSLALLSHPGVVQLTGVLVAGLVVVWALLGKRVGARKGWLLVGAALVVSTALVFVLYYSHFVEQQLHELAAIRAERAAEQAGKGFEALVGGSVTDRSLGLQQKLVTTRSEWILEGLAGFWREAVAYYRAAPLLWAALGFFVLPLVRRGAIFRRMSWTAATWAAVVLLFALVGLVANLYVRYSLFALPIVALGAGYLLAALLRRGRAGQWSAALITASFAFSALIFWYQRIEFAFK